MTETLSITCELATTEDEFTVKELFLSMLVDLAPFGHDILPTDRNVDLIWDKAFLPAIESGEHAIIIAKDDGIPVGAFFVVPEKSAIETPKRRCIAYGNWVHPEFRKQGIGVAMQEMGHRLMANLGIESLISAVMVGNKAGLASCQKAGAEIIGYVTEVRL